MLDRFLMTFGAIASNQIAYAINITRRHSHRLLKPNMAPRFLFPDNAVLLPLVVRQPRRRVH